MILIHLFGISCMTYIGMFYLKRNILEILPISFSIILLMLYALAFINKMSYIDYIMGAIIVAAIVFLSVIIFRENLCLEKEKVRISCDKTNSKKVNLWL